ILPIELTTAEIRNSKAYKEYHACAMEEAAPKPKASARKKNGDSASSTTPYTPTPTTTVEYAPRLSATAKGKQPSRATTPKSSDDEDVGSHEEGKESDESDDNRDEGKSEEESIDEEEQDLRLTEEARIQEEEDADELYRDVNINQGKGLQVTQNVEDTHVTLTPVNPDGPQESSSMSSFVSSMLNPISDVGVESIFTTTSSPIVSLETPTPIMTPSTIATIITSDSRFHSSQDDQPLTKLLSTTNDEYKFGMEVPVSMISDVIKKKARSDKGFVLVWVDQERKVKRVTTSSHRYILNEKGGPKEDMCIMSYQSQGVSVWEGAKVIHLQANDQVAIVSNKLKKDVMPRKTRSLTIAEELLVDMYDKWGHKLKGTAIEDPAIQSLLDLQKGSKANRLESLRQKKQPVEREGLSKSANETNDAEESNMDLSDDNPHGDDDALRKEKSLSYNNSTTKLPTSQSKEADAKSKKQYEEDQLQEVQAKVLTKIKKLLPTHIPNAIANYVRSCLNTFVLEVMKTNQINLFTQSSTSTNDLLDMDLKIKLLNRIYSNKSNKTHTTHQQLYDALYESITFDQDALVAQAAKLSFHKRSHDNQDPPNNREGENKKKIQKDVGKPSSRSSRLRLSRAQILWGMYNKKNVDFVSILWEDFMFQADNKEISSARKKNIPYPRFTNIIINHFISKDKTISMRSRINIHTVRNDTLLGTLKFVFKTQDYQIYGAVIPNEMINQNIKDSKAYNTYLDFATGKATPKEVYESCFTLKETISYLRRRTCREAQKKKASTKVDRGKGMDLLSEATLLKDAQLKKTLKKSKLETHKLHASGSGDGVGSQPKVPDESEDKTTDSDDDSHNDDRNNASNDDDDIDSDVVGDNEASDNERTDSDEYENLNLNQNKDEEEEYKEEYDVNVRLKDAKYEKEGKRDAEITDAGRDNGTQQTTYEQVKDDEHVILTTVHDTRNTKVPLQSSSISSDFAN
nr:hypothetical protein [Tanacetum cinerariifolium]